MKILLAEDDRVTRRVLESHITKWGHEVIPCSTGGQAWEILDGENHPRVAVIDWMMPEMTGVEVCRRVRENSSKPYVYIILLTAKGGQENIIEGLDAGADDYMVKPFNSNELKVRLRAGTRIIQLQEDLQSALNTSEYRASHDPLTGLKNRGAVLEALQIEMARFARQDTPLAVIIADVDYFKKVNDNYGHLAGDAVLQEIARQLKSSLRPYDSAGRYGGEEFLIVVPGCNKETALQAAERLRSLFEANPLHTPEGDFNITLSFGVTHVPKAGEPVDEIIRRADEALYAAKEAGRNRVEFFPSDTDGE